MDTWELLQKLVELTRNDPIDGSTDRRCFASVTNELALLSKFGQPVRKVRQTPYCVFQAGKQTFKDRHIFAIIWCIVNSGNGYELNNNKGKTDWNIWQCKAWKRRV